jgi:chromosome condensin MukBEF ATPase and DNA-binding subunit MukB
MSSFAPIGRAPSILRTASIAALLGATMLVSPLAGARAQSAASTPTEQTQKSPTAKAATDMKPETVEARIAKLHADLQITSEEESKWDSVAKAMRENASNMEKLVAEKRTQAPESMTAVDDLNNYQDFATAHLSGLKNLTSSFKSLYSSMPDAQKKNADQVFRSFGRTAQAN